MKHVTFTKAVPPHSIRDRRIVPDAVAAQLERDGAIAPNPPDYPDRRPAQAAPEPPRRGRRQTYQTK